MHWGKSIPRQTVEYYDDVVEGAPKEPVQKRPSAAAQSDSVESGPFGGSSKFDTDSPFSS